MDDTLEINSPLCHVGELVKISWQCYYWEDGGPLEGDVELL